MPRAAEALPDVKLVLTGAGGFIGGAVLHRCTTDAVAGGPVHVRALVSGEAGRERIARAHPGVEALPLYRPDGSIDAEAFAGSDVFLHAGWSSVPATAGADPAEDLRSNVEGGLRSIEAAAAAGVRRIVFLSSGGTVYGEPRHLPIREDHPMVPENSYGAAKLCLERYLGVRAAHHGMEHVVLRPGNVYGRPRAHERPQGVVEHWMMALLRGAPLEAWNDLAMVRDYLYIDDLVDAIMAALHRPLRSTVLNVGTGIGTDLRTLAELLQEVAGRKAPVIVRSSVKGTITANVLDASRLREEWGIAPRVGLREGAARTWAGLLAASGA